MLLLFWFALLLSGAPDHGRAGAPSPPAAGPSAYLRENFEQGDASFPSGWTTSRAIPEGDRGRFAVAVNPLVPGKLDHGLRTQDPLRFYAVSHPLNRPLHNRGRTLVVQFSVRFEQEEVMCAGGYVKLLMGPSRSGRAPADPFDAHAFDSRSDYALMFGPDVCGDPRIQFILRAEQHSSMAEESNRGEADNNIADEQNSQHENSMGFSPAARPMLRKVDLDTETEHRSHMYTLIIYGSDSSWEILVDDIVRDRGNMTDSFDFVPPLYVPDNAARKPLDWVDDEFVLAPGSAGKPAGYDDVPRGKFPTQRRAARPLERAR